MILAAIDPGKACLGWAIFDGTQLAETGFLEHCTPNSVVRDLKRTLSRLPDDVVIEVPQVYQQRQWKGDPNDLIDVAVIAGAVAASFAPIGIEAQLVRPRVWKGTRPKDVDNRLTISKLSSEELIVLHASGAPRSKLHNVIDAVGIGLWKLGRR